MALTHVPTPRRSIWKDKYVRDNIGRFSSTGGMGGETNLLAREGQMWRDEEIAATAKEIQRGGATPLERENAIWIASAEVEGMRTMRNGDTRQQNSNADGTWTPERAQLHDKILGEWEDANSDVPGGLDKPVVVFMGGLPGAGKSTATMDLNKSDKVVVNADSFKAGHDDLTGKRWTGIPEFKKGSHASLVHEESSYLADEALSIARDKRQSVIFDTTLGSLGGDSFDDAAAQRRGIAGKMQAFKDAGYRVEVRFVDVPVEVSVQRSLGRYLDAEKATGNGRYVPRQYVRGLMDPVWGSRNRKTFEGVKSRVDAWRIVDNSGGERRVIGESGTLTKRAVNKADPPKRLEDVWDRADDLPVTPASRKQSDDRLARLRERRQENTEKRDASGLDALLDGILAELEKRGYARDNIGRFSASGGGTIPAGSVAGDESTLTDAEAGLQARLVDFKTDRNLTGPDSQAITDAVPGADVTNYVKVPGLDAMHSAMGVTPTLDTNPLEYQAARDALFADMPIADVPFDQLTLTQPRVNKTRYESLAGAPSQLDKPVQILKNGDRHFVMNGHHRVAASVFAGRTSLKGRIFDVNAVGKRDYSRDPDGRFASGGAFHAAGDETGFKEPAMGEPFVVYRLGSENGGLDERNAGNADGVSNYIVDAQDWEKPQGGAGIGTHITAYRVTVNEPFTEYSGMGGAYRRPKTTGLSSSADPSGIFTHVGREATIYNQEYHPGRAGVRYSFPAGGKWTATPLKSVSLDEVQRQLVGGTSFEWVGGIQGADTIRRVFADVNKGA